MNVLISLVIAGFGIMVPSINFSCPHLLVDSLFFARDFGLPTRQCSLF